MPRTPLVSGASCCQGIASPGRAVRSGSVDGDAGSLGDGADGEPADGDDVGEGREEGVVVAAPEQELERVRTHRGTHSVQWVGDLEGVTAYVDRDPARVGEVGGLGEEAVGDVDEGGRPGLGGLLPGGVRRLRAAVGLDEDPR